MRTGPTSNVLLTGTDQDVAWLFRREVRSLGHTLIERESVESARLALSRDTVALVLLEDHRSSDQSLEFAAWLRESLPETRVILYTDQADHERSFKAGSLGVFSYIVKPFKGVGPLDRLFQAAIDQHHLAIREGRSRWHLETRIRSLASLVDRIPMGVILLDRGGRVRMKNRMASLILSENDGLSIGADGKLCAVGDGSSQDLNDIITSSVPALDGETFPTGGATTLPRQGGRAPLFLMVGPLETALSTLCDDEPVVAVIISDPEQQLEPREKILCRLYGFTPSQARLATKMMQGKSIEEAATELFISIHTARSHLKAMYATTETSGQVELLSLLWSGPAVIRLGRLVPDVPEP